jgi:hypothetical protein
MSHRVLGNIWAAAQGYPVLWVNAPLSPIASNADMTACLPLQDCIVQTTRLPAYATAGNFCRAAVQLTRLPAYGRIISRRYMRAAQLQWQVLKLHVCARCCPAALAVSQTAYKRSAVTCSGRIPNCMHVAAVALLPCCSAVAGYQSACAHCCPAIVAGSQPAS